jgi:hypothetical protein
MPVLKRAGAVGLARPKGVDILAKLLQRTVCGLGLFLRRSPDFHAGKRNEFALRPDSSVVERGPEKAGVGGSIPSLATTPWFWHFTIRKLAHAIVCRASSCFRHSP